MDALSQLIDLLTEKEKTDFSLFLSRKNKREDVKNIDLFNILKTDDIDSLKKLYESSKKKDAYHALRKRLHDNLLLFLSQKTFENSNSEVYDALRLVVVGRFLLENHLSGTGFKCLIKAERLAAQLEQFSLLNEILLLRLQYAHLNAEENLEELSEKFLINQKHLQHEAKLNLAYAFLRQELHNIHLKGKVINLTDLIAATIKKHHISVNDLMTYKSLYQILFIANEYAAIYQNYSLIEPYIRKSYQFIQSRKESSEYHLFHHLHILYYLANFNLRNRLFIDSKAYLKQLRELMEIQKPYYQLFYLRYQLLLALNEHFSGNKQDALKIIQDALQSAGKKYKQEDLDDLQLCLTMFLAQHNDSTCLRHLAKLTHSDAWYEKKLGMLWAIRKNLMEILIHAQFGNIDLATSRLQSFKRRYKKYLLTTNEKKVMDYVNLVEKSLHKPDSVFEKYFQKDVMNLLETKENDDIFNLSFIGWLIAKWKKETPYKTTIDLLFERGKAESGK